MSSRVTLVEPEAPPEPAATARAGIVTLVLLSLGHLSVDLYSGAVGALQPVLVERLGLSLTQAGILGGAFVFSSALMQPVYGYLSDRFRTKLFAALGPAIVGICISALGLAPVYGWLVAMVMLGGSGAAAFHPQASAGVARGTESRRGGWMAVFVCSGTLGLSIGPTYITTIVIWVGLPNSYLAALPGILVSLLLLVYLPAPARRASHGPGGFDWAPLHAVWKPLVILYLVVFFRSIVQITFMQFLPLYLHLERGFSLPDASYALTAYLAAGALGGFIGGHLSDWLGRRTVILLSMAGCLPFLGLFFFADGVVAMVGLVLSGSMLLFTIPVNVVMAQELVPSQAGTVSALMMGFAWGAAGIVFIPLIGWASDAFSMHQVLMTLLVFPAIGFLLALKLKK